MEQGRRGARSLGQPEGRRGPNFPRRSVGVNAPPDVPALTRWRVDTPGCERRVHLNNAGAALTPHPVREAVDAHLDLEQELGGYAAADARGDAIRQVYAALGRLVGGAGRNIALAQNSTAAFSMALAAF